MNFFTKYIIGGKTGKRESAWFVFLLFAIGVVWMGWREVHGFSVDAIKAILLAALPLIVGYLLVAHGMEWTSKQTDWGGALDNSPSPPEAEFDEPPYDEFEENPK